ncbi:hypothetical protein TanjilG_26937 [Lupinus angustifolius]|uniref:Uncharacterized protein n=1 Tax=Lupinus angustifolius TaxID=3871 RepID=A0A4P1RIV7_LUPAN|nr:hypothetical protein TanjilG_26937 [Lupinus angustifolius]
MFKLKKPEKDKSKQEKVLTNTESSNWKQSTHDDSSVVPSEGIMIDRTIPSRMIDEIAAMPIRNVFHSFMVEWCNGHETMAEILSRLQRREEAVINRKRAMAYAFTHQVQNLLN